MDLTEKRVAKLAGVVYVWMYNLIRDRGRGDDQT